MTFSPIDSALNIRPLEIIDNATGEVTEVSRLQDEEYVDPDLLEAQQDAALVKDNIKHLMTIGMEMLEDVTTVAKQTQNPDQYQAGARWFAEVVKSNKELMNIHRDMHAIKPPAPVRQQAETINNTYVSLTSDEMSERVRQLLGTKPLLK